MSRRLVVVLFLDLVGWTGLAERVDPEPLQQMLERYYEICSTAVEEAGGTVEKFIGDAIMAAFGAARSREDDAVRALRAAERIRSEVGDLGVRVHCGVAAGEALVTWSSRAGLRVVGDVVNLAARLQSAATADEIVVNEVVASLVGPHYTLEPLPPLGLKGKSSPVPAWRVGAVLAARTDDGTPMIDRDDERSRLRSAYAEVARSGQGRTVAVAGPPGIGKTRLVREVVGRSAVFGTCPSYGPDVALFEVLTALTRPGAVAHDLLGTHPRLAAVLAALRTPPARPAVDEIAWAARTVIGFAASRAPLVVVWDGLEWAGPSLLRLIASLTAELRDLPLLVVCVARPGPILTCDDLIELGGLGEVDSARMAASLGAEVEAHSAGVIERVTRHSAGNPLFIRLMVESGGPSVPPTITALVGALLDQLPSPAREALGRASVVGSAFTAGQLATLGPAEPGVLEALVVRRLIRPAAGGFCFVQQPVHEVVYGRLEKKQRLAWHRRLADTGVSPGFHLEAAVRLLGDLRPDDPDLGTLAEAGAVALLEDGTAALRQRDIPAAVGLLERAVALSPGEQRSVAAIRLSDALLLSGDTRRAALVVADLGARAAGPRERRRCHAQHLLVAARLGSPVSSPGVAHWRDLVADPADRIVRCRTDQVRMLRHLSRGRFGAAERAARSALAHARAAGDSYEQDRLLAATCELRQWSPTPIADQLAGCAELAARFAGDRFLLVPVLAAWARGLALTGDAAGARAALGEAAAAVRDLRLTMGAVLVDQAAGLASAMEGDHAAAEQRYRRAASVVEQAGHRSIALALSAAAVHASALRGPVRRPELSALLDRLGEMDVRGRLICLATAARTGDPGRAAEALALLSRTDDPCLRGDVQADLAYAARRLGREAEAFALADAAIAAYDSIGAIRPAEVVRSWR